MPANSLGSGTSLLAGLMLFATLAGACGGSSSETPTPLAPRSESLIVKDPPEKAPGEPEHHLVKAAGEPGSPEVPVEKPDSSAAPVPPKAP